MPEIVQMAQGHPLWNKTLAYARSCPWRAGAVLAQKMEQNDFLPWERVIVAVEEGCILAYCTLTERDELPDEYSFSPFIGFVFVDENHRGKRLSGQLIASALRYAASLGYRTVYIMSGEVGLYEKYGFEKLGEYRTIYGTIDQLFHIRL